MLQSLYYTYDDDGQRTRIVREDNTRIYYDYDAAHRLTAEDWLDPTDVQIYAFDYDYDAAGNRLKKTFNGGVTYYDYNTLNQLATERVLGGGATYYTWTDDGAMATKHEGAGWTYYTWDVDESLTKIQTPDTTLENKYNSRMQRVARDEDGTAEKLIYDSQKLIAEAGVSGLSHYYLSEGGSVYSPLVSQRGSQEWFLFDALGSTLGLTGGAGSLSDTFRYEAFGTGLGRTGTTETSYQYVGRHGYFREFEASLYQVGSRWLATDAGGWLGRDRGQLIPQLSNQYWGTRGGWHPYSYAANRPTDWIDPSGDNPVVIVEIVIAVAGVILVIYLVYAAVSTIITWCKCAIATRALGYAVQSEKFAGDTSEETMRNLMASPEWHAFIESCPESVWGMYTGTPEMPKIP